MSALLHIASVLVQHRPASTALLDAAIARLDGVELALREAGRSVLLCESVDESALLRCIDTLQTLDGVIAVSLVHHHAELAASLMEEIDHDHAA